MFFDTPIYFVFLTAIVLVYWRLGFRSQNVLLLAASYFFYGWWDYRFLALMLISTVVDFFMAQIIADTKGAHRRKIALVVSLLLNFGFLGWFKYFNFFVDTAQVLARSMGASEFTIHALEIVLPPGISFYTFQAVAYVVDVYSGKLKVTRNFVDYALFISLFPHLIAGPIQRPGHLLPQVEKPRGFHAESVFDGLMLIATGLFRKVVVADNCALIADAAFGGRLGPDNAVTTLVGVYAFAWQIYADFSGYSDIARGSAQLLGFHFMVNFRQPYLALSLSEFWRRWHISLSTWLRDYLYIGLGGNRHGEAKTYRNLFLTMLLGGLWHGANWTFVVWGALHGCGLAIERRFFPSRHGDDVASKYNVGMRWLHRVLLFQFVCFAWIFFRAPTFGRAFEMLSALGTWTWNPGHGAAIVMVAAFAIPLFFVDSWIERARTEYPSFRAHGPRVALACAMLLVTAVVGAADTSAFIYFQF